MKYVYAKPFSNGTEYEIFKSNYCKNGCIHHKEREDDGFPEFIEDGGCPIEDRMEYARFEKNYFPNILYEIWENESCLNWHHCPFFDNPELLEVK